MRIETFSMPAGWVSTGEGSGSHTADLLKGVAHALTGAGWSLAGQYKAKIVFTVCFSVPTVPNPPIPDAKKYRPPCVASTPRINGVTFRAYDPFRAQAGPGPCLWYELSSQGIYFSALNFMALANGVGPYVVELGGDGQSGYLGPNCLEFTATAKLPGPEGDWYPINAQNFHYFDRALGNIDCYGGYSFRSPPDHAGNRLTLRLWMDEWFLPHFQLTDSYGKQVHWLLWTPWRWKYKDDMAMFQPLIFDFQWYYSYKFIATRDTLVCLPVIKTHSDGQNNVARVSDVEPPHTTGHFFFTRAIPTQEQKDAGLDSSLLLRVPYPMAGPPTVLDMGTRSGDSEPWALAPLLNGMSTYAGVNGPLIDFKDEWIGTKNRSFPGFVVPRFANDNGNGYNPSQILTTQGNLLRTPVFIQLASAPGKESSIVGKMRCAQAVTTRYPVDAEMTTHEADGQVIKWRLIYTEGLYREATDDYWASKAGIPRASIFHAITEVKCGAYFAPGGVVPDDEHRELSYSADYLTDPQWTILPWGNVAAFTIVGGEGLTSIDLYIDDQAWPIVQGTVTFNPWTGAVTFSADAGDSGVLYWGVTRDFLSDCSRGWRLWIWGYPTCSQVGDTFSYTFRVTDSIDQTMDIPFNFTVLEGPYPSIEVYEYAGGGAIGILYQVVNNHLPQGEVGEPYKIEFVVGCVLVEDTEWNIKGGIPPGLSLRPGNRGFLEGTPTDAGEYEFEVEAEICSAFGCSHLASHRFLLTIIP